MWHAMRRGKLERFLGRQSTRPADAWREAVARSEDLLTSGVFERLAYLPGSMATELVRRAAIPRGGGTLPPAEPLLESLAWPRPSEDEQKEPDWVWLTAGSVLVFEAKWGPGVVPEPTQLEDQARVCRQRWPGRALLQVAVVQSGDVEPGPGRWQLTWAALRLEAGRALAATAEPSTRRVLQDLADFLDARGVSPVWLDSLPAISIDPTAQGAPMDLPEKLTNVRRATRLLAAYHRRLLAIGAAVDAATRALGDGRTRFVEWRPTHHRPIGNQTSSPFDRWGWDFVPLMDAWFWWTTDGRRSPVGPGSLSVMLWHQGDSGYRRGGGEPDPVGFDPAEQSTTTLSVHVFALAAGPCGADWDAIDKKFGSDDVSGAVRECAPAGLDGTGPGTVIRYVGWRVSVADLATETDVEVRLLKPLRDHLAALMQTNP